MKSIPLPDGELVLRTVRPDEAHLVLAAVARSPVFCMLPPAGYKKLLPFFRIGEASDRTQLAREDDVPTALFMVVSGAVDLGPSRGGPGTCFGALAPDPSPCEATVTARGDTRVATLTPVQLRVLARALPELQLED